jgi:hypothetical protein
VPSASPFHRRIVVIGTSCPPLAGRGVRLALAVVAATALVVAVAGCGGTDDRPRTPATIEIVSPEPNEVTTPDLTVQLKLSGAELVSASATGGEVDPRRGHVHVSVDGRVMAMANDLEVPVAGLEPGAHVIQAEFVATDHLPFANEVFAAVTFTVA